jgi:penicillin-binding protein 1A
MARPARSSQPRSSQARFSKGGSSRPGSSGGGPPGKPPRRGLVLRLLAAIPAFLMLALVGWVVLFFTFAPRLPNTDELFKDSEQATVTLLADDGSVLARRGAEGRRFVSLGDISPLLVKAVIATEDHRFYEHFGIDPVGMIRAAFINLRAGSIVAGGSTITQQLAKNLYLTPERSLRRKLEELTLALWLEARLSKNQILTLYLNRVYLGAGAYGVEAASERYFGKPAAKVSLAEAAMIAGLLKAPSALAPTNDLDRARERAGVVLDRMVDAGYITKAQAQAAKLAPARLAPESQTDLAGWFVDWVLDGLTDSLGKPEHDLVVRTTLDRRIQRASETALRKVVEGPGVRRGVEEGAIVVLDTSGAVRAMVGGDSYRQNRFNRAAFARRQPGSAFKPFLYLTALESGYRPGTVIEDRPLRIGSWSPSNFDGKANGKVTLEEALTRSLNLASVGLIMKVGAAKVAKTARQLGIVSDLQAVPSLALGTSEVTPLELTAAYIPFATGGVRRPVFAVKDVREAGGRTLYRYTPTDVRVMPPDVAAEMQQLLRHVVDDGTGRAADLGARPAAGKTGTTQNSRDAWFVGYSGSYVAGVWLGNDDDRPMRGVTGGSFPAQIWRDVMLATPAPSPAVAGRQPGSGKAAGDEADLASHGLDWIIRLVQGALETARQ